MNDLPAHLRPIEIPPATLSNWLGIAEAIARAGEPSVLWEVKDLQHDATPHRLQRCIKAAQYAEKVTSEPYRSVARTLAVDLDVARRLALSAPAKAV